MWHHDKQAVTILLFPDHANDARALLTLTPDAAECLADELRQCAAWTRDLADRTPEPIASTDDLAVAETEFIARGPEQ